ncbi:putative ubiquitin-conjugating enzyme E2 24 [Cocos nucifera]|uniref:E2 ubiquitin-conjugating enzyme n=1 Tax=Cocos nucifera TaxID=13894 RepID=A0A8K0IBT0_COCNU|nr:putative ubiquitin-conjugating enzyme E2 24 [Cocos nucifera]
MDLLVIDSESEAYTDASDSEEQDDTESAYGGHAQSILSSLDESIGKIDDFLALERSYIHGDIVCSTTDPSGQLGRVMDVDMMVDLETVSCELIKDVNSKKLLRIRSFAPGDYVVHGSWLGRVERVFDLVTILFNDGAKCEILMRDSEILIPLSTGLLEDAPYPYYPGQRVRINVPTISKSARWLCGSWKVSRDEGTVCHVDVGSVHVTWIASIMISRGIHPSTPPYYQDPRNLTLLSCFPYVNWQLGDWCTLSDDYFHDTQVTAEKSAPLNAAPRSLTKMQKELGINGRDYKQMYVIAKTKSKVEVLWQNGDYSVGLDPQTLFPVNNLDDHDFWPGQLVLEKVTLEDVHVPRLQRLGIVKSVDAHERTVNVKWIAPEVKQAADCSGASGVEMVSAYELVENPDISYSIGDIVFRHVPNFEDMENNLEFHSFGQRQLHNVHEQILNNSLLRKDALQKKHIDEAYNEDFQGYLSYIGNVIGCKDECIQVRWASGIVSKVQPFEIIGLDKLLDSAYTPSSIEESIPPTVSKEIAEQERQLLRKKEKNIVNDASGDCLTNMWRSTALLFPQSAFGFLTNVAASLFGSRDLNLMCFTIQKKGVSEYQILKTEELKLDLHDLDLENLKQRVEEAKQSEEPTFLSGNGTPTNYKQFDVVDDYSDHHFLNSTGGNLLSSQVTRGWLKKVQQEWSILKKDLPDSIYVRVYEERMDLLRASIVGAPGTPYHDGLFFFDIFFPPDYPHEPPLVHYKSGGLRLNPNLYESGKVCLSLLKTWTGTGTEVWNPESSTILQVLLSIQALVLNEKPYFNEAGYDKQIGRAEGEKNSISYNENAFILSCKSMLYLLQNPPKHFEALVEEHFTRRSHDILVACKAYLDGAQVGHAYECAKVLDQGQKHCSHGFKIMLAKLFPKLIAAFTERGIDCSQFLNQVHEFPGTDKDLN